MSVYEFLVRHGVDYAQGAVILGLIVAAYVGWVVMARGVQWAEDSASYATWQADSALDQVGRVWEEVDALKTRVKTLEDSVARSKQRDAEKKRVRIANVA